MRRVIALHAPCHAPRAVLGSDFHAPLYQSWRVETRPNFYITRNGDFCWMKILFLIFEELWANNNLSTSPTSFRFVYSSGRSYVLKMHTLSPVCFLFHLSPTHHSIIVFPQSVRIGFHRLFFRERVIGAVSSVGYSSKLVDGSDINGRCIRLQHSAPFVIKLCFCLITIRFRGS